MNTQRQEWLDITKGLLIILVVYGHSAFIQHYSTIHTFIYWFHMPAFFFLSGYLFKIVEDWSDFTTWSMHQIKKYMSTYLFFAAIITIYRYFFTPVNIKEIWGDFANILLGGRFIDGYYAPFWFITCLLFTQLLFVLIMLSFRANLVRWLLIGFLFLSAHLESWYFPDLRVPLNIDVSLFSLFFFATGHFIGRFILKDTIAFISVVCTVILIYLGLNGHLHYFLDMKQHTYQNIFGNIFIPIVGTISIITLGKMFESSPFKSLLALIGRNSLTIMYLHLIISIELYRYKLYDDVFVYIIVGVLAPILFEALKSKFSLYIKRYPPSIMRKIFSASRHRNV